MSDSLHDLPDDVRQAIQTDAAEPSMEVLAAIGVQLAIKREEAKAARTYIESVWQECDDQYDGIDDANRHEFAGAKWAKPMSMDSPVTTSRRDQNPDHKSTVYHRLTSRYVDAGVAKLGEILLPADEKAFSFSEMPVPELIAASDDESHVVHSELGVPLSRPLAKGETPPSASPTGPIQPPEAQPGWIKSLMGRFTSRFTQPAQEPVAAPDAPPPQPPTQPTTPAPPRVPLTVKDFAVEAIEMARKKAKAAETRIYDWMVETQYRAEIRKVIADAARIGVGVLKAPTPKSKRVMAITKAPDGGVTLEIKEKIIPAACWVDPWNIFPDPACGENIHDGDYVFERDFMSARQVRGLKKLPGYIADQLDQVLEEGPEKVNVEGAGHRDAKSKSRFTIWYFYGSLTKEEMAAIDAASGKVPSQDDTHEEAHAIVTLINDSVVRAVINPLDSGEFPYHSMPWQRRAGHWAGVGVAEQMKTPQKITNAALRALLNNAGKSAGSQLVINRSAIKPSDGNWMITPDKIWETTAADVPDDIRKVFMAVEIPNVGEQLERIITLGERFAEEVTSIPLIAQGQSGATTPDTFGAAQLQNNNANQLLRSIGYGFDDYITEPVVRQYYEWLLLDPDVPNEEKGEFQVDAHGSVALVERAIQDQSIAQMGQMAAPGNGYGVDPKKWAKLFVKSKRLNPDDVMYSEEDQAKLDAAPPPEPPAVTVAKINADTQIKLGVMAQTAAQRTEQNEAQIAAGAHALEVGQAQVDETRVHGELTIKANQIQMEHDRALMEYANKNGLSLTAAKTELAKTAMSLQTERDLHQQDMAVDLHKHHNPPPPPPMPPGARPPVQTPGRAGNGRSFEQGPAQ